MRKRIFLLVVALVMAIGCAFAQSTSILTCKVLDNGRKKVTITFCNKVSLLGANYEKLVMMSGKKKIEFADGTEAVNYLKDSWGWELEGKPVNLKNGETLYILKREVYDNGRGGNAQNIKWEY